MITNKVPPVTGVPQPWAEGQPVSAQRLNGWQDRTVMEIRVAPGSGLTMLRNGNSVVLGSTFSTSGVGQNAALINIIGPSSTVANCYDGTVQGTGQQVAVLHFNEGNGASTGTHLLAGGQYPGIRDGTDAGTGTPIYRIGAIPLGRESLTTGSPTALGSSSEGSESADSSTWTRGLATTDGVTLWVTCRVVWNETGDKVLYSFARQLLFDSCGLLRKISAETRINVDTAGPCS